MTKTIMVTFIAALALVVAGCGGSNDESSSASPTDEWASGFCTAITTWTDSIQTVTEQFTDPSSLSQDGLESAANDVKTSTSTLVDDLKGLGAPDTASGQDVKNSVDELSSTLEGEVATIDEAVQGASGLTGLLSAGATITTSLKAMGTAFSTTLQTVQSADAKGELQTALEDSPDCASITS
jgi:Flp pilus assembly protein TadD